MAYRVITVVLNASTAGLTAGLGRAAGQVSTFNNSLQRALGVSPKALSAGITGLTVALGYSVIAAIQFEERMRNVASISPKVAANFEYFNNVILDLSRHLPQTANDLAEGFYQIVSSGFDGRDAIDVLNASAKAATAGLSTTAQAVTAITSVLNSFGYQAKESTRVSDALFATVDYGVITFPQLTQTIAHFAGTAARAGVSIEDAGTAIAVMTRAGLSASESGVSLNQVLGKLLKPSTELSTAMQKLGINLQKDLANPAIGLKGVMDELRVASEGNIATILKWFPEIRAARGVLALMTQDGALYNQVFGLMGDRNKTAGLTQHAFNEQMKATSAQLKETWNRVNALAIQLGTHLLPGIQSLLKTLTDFGHSLTTVGSQLWTQIRPGFESVAHAVANLSESARRLLGDFGPVIALLAGAGIGAAVVAFRALAAAVQGVTGVLRDHHAIVAGVAAAMSLLLLPVLRRVVVAGFYYLVLGINAALTGLGSFGAWLTRLNPLLVAAQVGIGVLAYSFIKSRQEAAKFSGEVQSMTAALGQAKAQGSDQFLSAISKAIAPLSGYLRDAGVQIGPLVNNLARGGDVAANAWERAKQAALDHAREIGASDSAIRAISKSYDVVGKSLNNLNTEEQTAVEAQKAHAAALADTKAKLDPLAQSLLEVQQKHDAWYKVVGEANKALSSQNDLLKQNTIDRDVNAAAIRKSITENVKLIAAENTNIVKLQAAGLPQQFVRELINHGPEYVAAVAGMGKQQMMALANEWSKGLFEVNRRGNLWASTMAPEQAKSYSDSLEHNKSLVANSLTDTFVKNLHTALETAKGIAGSGGATMIDEHDRKVRLGAPQLLQAYISTLPMPLQVAVKQALGISATGGHDIPQEVADNIIKNSGVTGTAAQKVKDIILGEFRKIGPGIRDTQGDITHAAQGIATALNTALNNIGHKVDIDVQARLQSIIGKQSYIDSRGATGGRVIGPGSGTSDEAGVFALSNNEWVIRESSTSKYGHAAMKSINDGTAVVIPGMATGGRIGHPQIYNVQGHPPSTDDIAHQIGKMAMDNLGSLVGDLAVGGGLGGAVGVQRWAGTFLQALLMAGQSPGWLGLGLQRLGQESGGNPLAVNRSDINWLRGTPSVGLMQVIGPTFQRWAGSLRGVGPFLYGTSVNPLANIYAAIRYTLGAYGSLAAWGRPGGYAAGVDFVPSDGFRYLHRGERVVPASHNTSSHSFAPVVNITVMGGDSPQVTAQAIKREVQGVMGNYVRQLRVGTGRY